MTTPRLAWMGLLLAAGAATAGTQPLPLDIVEVKRDDEDGVVDMNGPWSLGLAPGGAHLYVLALHDDAIVTFARDAGNGTLTFLRSLVDGSAGVTRLANPAAIAFSPDGEFAYVAVNGDGAVVVLDRDPADGTLAFVEDELLSNASFVAVSPDGAHVYATAGLASGGTLTAYARDGATGALAVIETESDGLGGVDGLDEANCVAVSPDGAHVYATGTGEGAVAVFSRSASTGELTFVEREDEGMGTGSIPIGLAVSPDGTSVYVTMVGPEEVAAFSRNPTTGALTYLATYGRNHGGPALANVFAVAVSHDAATVYVAGRGDSAGGMTAFERDPATGALSLLRTLDPEGTPSSELWAGALAVSADDAFVYRGGFEPKSVHVFTGVGEASVPPCGNGTLDGGEGCDDGNTAAGDCCSATCQPEADGGACSAGGICSPAGQCQDGACVAGEVPCADAALSLTSDSPPRIEVDCRLCGEPAKGKCKAVGYQSLGGPDCKDGKKVTGARKKKLVDGGATVPLKLSRFGKKTLAASGTLDVNVAVSVRSRACRIDLCPKATAVAD
jgi:cysteine-rich repeat protein